jgi:4-hydroxybenzoate polyprenyltransferase
MNLRALASMVKLSHSLFALPFVAAAVVLVARDATLDAVRLAWVAVAVVAARTAAMTMNRIADRRFDERNPRTMKRELVTGAVSPAAAWGLLAGASALVAQARLAALLGVAHQHGVGAVLLLHVVVRDGQTDLLLQHHKLHVHIHARHDADDKRVDADADFECPQFVAALLLGRE